MSRNISRRDTRQRTNPQRGPRQREHCCKLVERERTPPSSSASLMTYNLPKTEVRLTVSCLQCDDTQVPSAAANYCAVEPWSSHTSVLGSDPVIRAGPAFTIRLVFLPDDNLGRIRHIHPASWDLWCLLGTQLKEYKKVTLMLLWVQQPG